MENSIVIKNVSKTYLMFKSEKDKIKFFIKFKKNIEKKHIFKNINLNIKKGENIGLYSPNGSGKSTLLKLIGNKTNLDSGKIETYGKIVPMVSTQSGFQGEMTGIQNIYLVGQLYGISKKVISTKVKDIVEFSELGKYINMPTKTYSSGMKARLAFSIKIFFDFDIYLLDEALSVGDRAFSEKCFDKISEVLKSKSKTFVIASHNFNNLKKYCDKVYEIKNLNLERLI